MGPRVWSNSFLRDNWETDSINDCNLVSSFSNGTIPFLKPPATSFPDTVDDAGPRIQDRDGDTIQDEIDFCPDEKETWNKFQDRDGCPDIFPDQSRSVHDLDLDGIIDDQDMCPESPEDHDGDSDEDGCPDP